MTNEIKTILGMLNLTEEELIEVSELANNKAFQKLCSEIMRVKKDAIIETIGTQAELDRARLTLEGNREIIETIALIDSKYRQDIHNKKEEEDDLNK
jgi:hypothetical protein